MMNAIQNQYIAFRDFQTMLKSKGYKPVYTKDGFNKGRHQLIQAGDEIFYCVYHREWFNSFSSKFPDFIKTFPMFEGVGESLNESCLKLACNVKADRLVFIHPKGVYWVYPNQMYKFGVKYGLKRKQDKANLYNVHGVKVPCNEFTISYPKKLLKVWE